MVMRRSTAVRNAEIIKKLDAGTAPKDVVAELNLSSVDVVYDADRPAKRRVVLAVMKKLKGRRRG